MPDDLTPVVVPCGAVLIRCWPASLFLETRWPDGATVGAGPNYDPASVALAAQLGYTGHEPTWQMSRDHESIHTWLAVQCGLHWSPTLRSVAYKYTPVRGMVPDEEKHILDFQRYLNTGEATPCLTNLVICTGRSLPELAAAARLFLQRLTGDVLDVSPDFTLNDRADGRSI